MINSDSHCQTLIGGTYGNRISYLKDYIDNWKIGVSLNRYSAEILWVVTAQAQVAVSGDRIGVG